MQPASWTPWLSGLCSTACGTGTATLNRTCVGACQLPDSACTVGQIANTTSLCNAGPAAAWTLWTPSACSTSTNLRPWQRSCTLNCYGFCSGADTDLRDCQWNDTVLWAGPIPQSQLPLTWAQQLVDLLTDTLHSLSTVDYGAARLAVPPVGNHTPSHELLLANNSIAGGVWVAIEVPVFQVHYEAAILQAAVLAINDSRRLNISAVISLSPLPPSALTTTTAAPSKSSSGAGVGVAGAAAGAAGGAIVVLVVGVLIVRHRRRRHKSAQVGAHAGWQTAAAAPTNDMAGMVVNPVYSTGKEIIVVESQGRGLPQQNNYEPALVVAAEWAGAVAPRLR